MLVVGIGGDPLSGGQLVSSHTSHMPSFRILVQAEAEIVIIVLLYYYYSTEIGHTPTATQRGLRGWVTKGDFHLSLGTFTTQKINGLSLVV